MTRALQLRQTGDLYRLVGEGWPSVRPGMLVQVYGALLKKGGPPAYRRQYDGILNISYDPELHTIKEVEDAKLEAQERHRFLLRLCRRYHPDKVREAHSLPGEFKPSSMKPLDWQKKTVQILEEVQLYFREPQKFDPTRLSTLKFDLDCVLGYYKRAGAKDGSEGGSSGTASPGDAKGL